MPNGSKPINRFDLRRQNVYARKVLSGAEPLLEAVSFLPARPSVVRLPEDVMEAVRLVSNYDTQYTLQVEEVDTEERNLQAAPGAQHRNRPHCAVPTCKANRPDVVIVPNGTIQELGVVYRVARYLEIPTVTYEFGDQRQRIWLAQNGEVMRQETDELWAARNGQPLSDEQLERMRSLFAARQRGALWENFARRWQDTPAQGGEQVRADAGPGRPPGGAAGDQCAGRQPDAGTAGVLGTAWPNGSRARCSTSPGGRMSSW